MIKKKNILITGGLGYIGTHIAANINTERFNIFLIDNLSNSKLSTLKTLKRIVRNKIHFKKLDILNHNLLSKYLKKKSIDIVIHLAALKAVAESEKFPEKYYRNNILGTISLLNAMNQNCIKKIIYSSSATVYGIPKKLPIKETDMINPENFYGLTKKNSEEIIKLFSEKNNFKYVILRYFNPAGCHKSYLIGEDPQGTPNNLFPYIGKVISKKKTHLYVYGKNYSTKDDTGARDYIHIDDLAEAHIKTINLIEKSNFKNEILNLGSGKYFTVKQVINAFKKYCGYSINYKFKPKRDGDVDCLYTDISYAQKILDWKLKKKLKEICVSTYKYYAT